MNLPPASTLTRQSDTDVDLAWRSQRHEEVLQQLRDDLRWTPWWNLGEKSHLRAQLTDEQHRADECARQLMERDTWQRLARRTVFECVSEVRRTASHRNAFHPEVLEHLETLVAEAADRARTHTVLDVADHAFPFEVEVATTPPILTLLTEQYVEQTIRDEVAGRSQIAARPLLELDLSGNGTDWVVQHPTTHHRALFKVDPATLFGRIDARPGIGGAPDINPDHESSVYRLDAMDGLGIGERIYLRGAELNPGVRWETSSPRPGASAALRTKLHTQDPYLWAPTACTWCSGQSQAGTFWNTATPTQMKAHPRP